MKVTSKILACLICALPCGAFAQASTAPSGADKSSAAPPAGMQSKKSSETGETTTYPKSDASSSAKKSAATDKEKDRITKGGANSPASPIAPLDPATTDKPAKEGSQSGPKK